MPAPPLILRQAEYRVMPWKNGGGTTAEIAVEPPAASAACGFLWRLSLATIDQSGPFSAFPGCERTILLVEGDGFVLDIAGQEPIVVDRRFRPAVFSGDRPAACRLRGGPSRDLNLMIDRARIQARSRVLELADNEMTIGGPAGECLAVYLDGTAAVEIDGAKEKLARLDTLRLPSGATSTLRGTAILFVAELSRRRQSSCGSPKRKEDHEHTD
ncbi:MAG: HutD family protein [Proteobacteria bacterium]|nr:HutD family protein [Pseudomonadota bacterium]